MILCTNIRVGNIVVELPWQTIMAVIMYFTWYYPVGLYRNAEATNSVHERGALMFLYICKGFP